MRVDKLASLRQRLRRNADAFDFNALIQGVSTLDEPSAEIDAPAEAAPAQTPEVAAEAAPVAQIAEAPVAEPPASAGPEVARAAEPALQPQPEPVVPEPVAVSRERAPEPAAEPVVDRADRLHAALNSLGERLLPEVRLLGAAMHALDADEAGFRLAHVNQLLELLRSIDPTADLARQLGTACAPPAGHGWMPTAWSVAEFAESPLSALLPAQADEAFVRDVVYSAWGVSFE